MPFSTFYTFHSKEEAASLLAKLDRKSIPYQWVDISPSVDLTFGGNVDIKDNFALDLQPEDFAQAEKFLEEEARVILEHLGKDHYLYEFSDEELVDVLKHYDQWSKLDFLLAVEVLKKRGLAYTGEDIRNFKDHRLRILRRPKSLTQPLRAYAYFRALLGDFQHGRRLRYETKQLPDGKKVYTYDQKTRKFGLRLFYFGLVMAAAWTSLALYIFFHTTAM